MMWANAIHNELREDNVMGMRNMKRSKLIRLGLLGAGVVILVACGEDEPEVSARVYESVEQCEKATDANHPENGPVNTAAECRKQFDEARKVHEEQAPRYTDKARCEEEFGSGNCESRNSDSSSNSTFMPMMMGYMMGSMSNGNTTYIHDRGSGTGDAGRRHYSSPLYRPYSSGAPGAFVTPNGTSIRTSSSGTVAASTAAFKPPPAGTVVSRGGFSARSSGSSVS